MANDASQRARGVANRGVEHNVPEGKVRTIVPGKTYNVVGFDIGKADLKKAGFDKELEPVVRQLQRERKEYEEGKRTTHPIVTVTGHASESVQPGKGPKFYASARSEAVKQYLIARDIPPDWIQTTTSRESPPSRRVNVHESPDRKALARSATIEVGDSEDVARAAHRRSLESRYAEPPEYVTLTPASSVAGRYADSSVSRRTRQTAFGILNPAEAILMNNLLSGRIVRNFQERSKLRKNAAEDLARIGIAYDPRHDRGEGTNGSQQNAFRHAFGQALATAMFGRAKATEAAYAHEEHPDINTSRRDFIEENNPIDALFRADTVADLLNNEIGRQIAEHTLTKDAKELAKATLREFYKNGLYTCEFLGHGVARVRREPLELEQFSESMDAISRLNWMGLTADEDQLQRSTEEALGWRRRLSREADMLIRSR